MSLKLEIVVMRLKGCELDGVFVSIPIREKVVIGGDFNRHVVKDRW